RKAQAESVGKWSGACCPALVNGAIHRITNTAGTTAASYSVTAGPSPMNCAGTPTDIGDTPSYPAMSLSISPNPFSALATITFNISTSASVSAEVYSVTGERVRHMDNAEFAQGTGRLLWDGKDDGGRALPSGVYMVRVKANQTEATRRVTILR
ncbi:MAG TPA: FlgD immunoglobulin-like domain containing protein, partial [Candidatus Krumholzibacteria bacterium]